MCGICGYISSNNYPEEIIRTMNETIRHRGPDDFGVLRHELNNGYYLAMGHTRLSVLDLSDAGHQPMYTRERNFVIVFNGEIYNFRELRHQLAVKGYTFESDCDTEVILYLYKEFGVEAFRLLNGMFAIGIYDFEQGELLLVRDRMGKKPLYYYILEGGKIIAFGSELKPLLKFPEFHKEIRTELISSYLVNKSFESPNTVFRNTYKLEPGQYLIWKNGKLLLEKYWDVVESYVICSQNQEENYQMAKRHLRELLLDSVERRMIADVPVGTFLSGGIDSSLVSAYAREISDRPVRTFTIGFYTKEENEAEYAKAVSKYLGTKHRELYITEDELFGLLDDLIYYYDEPFSDSSQIPSMLVSKLAKEDATVILSGDGGDELFCGYEMYDWMWLAQRLDGVGEFGYRFCKMPKVNRFNLIERLPDKAYAFAKNRAKMQKLQLFNDIRERHTREMVLGQSRTSKFKYEEKIHETDAIADNWQMQRMLLDMRYYLADEILVKTDRASMKYALEIRCPILDYRIVEYSYSLPHEYKYGIGKKKKILKDLAYEVVPKQLLNRPKKGFGVPLVKWLRGPLYSQLLQYADENVLRKQDIFKPEKVQEMISKLLVSDLSVYNSILWGFYIFQMWYQEYVEDLWNT